MTGFHNKLSPYKHTKTPKDFIFMLAVAFADFTTYPDTHTHDTHKGNMSLEVKCQGFKALPPSQHTKISKA